MPGSSSSAHVMASSAVVVWTSASQSVSRAQVLGQLSDGGLGAAHDLGAVARRDEGDLLAHGSPTTAAMASTNCCPTASPCELGGAAGAVGDQRPAQRVVGQDAVHGGGHVRRVLRLEQEGGVAGGLAHGAHVAGHDRDAGGHRLDQGHAEALVHREREEHVGRLVVRGQRGVGDLPGDPHRLGQPEVVGEVVERLAVLVARRAPDQVQPGLRVVEAAVRPERLDELVLRLGRHDAAHEEEVGAAVGPAPGQLGLDAGVGPLGDPAVVGQGGGDRRAPAPGRSERPLAEAAAGQPEHRLGCEEGEVVGRLLGAGDVAGLPAGEELGAREVVEVEDQGEPVLGQIGGDGRRRRELVDGDVTGGRVLGVHPVLVRLGGQVVVDGLGEDLRAPPRLAQHVAQLERVGARRVVRVQGGEELVDRHRPPGGVVHRAGGAEVVGSKGVSPPRTAVTR